MGFQWNILLRSRRFTARRDKTVLALAALALGMAAHGGAVARHRQVIGRRRPQLFGANSYIAAAACSTRRVVELKKTGLEMMRLAS